MSFRTNGLIPCGATNSNVANSYFLKKGEPIPEPTLIAPVALESADGEGTTELVVRGFVGGVATPYTGGITINPGASSLAPAPAGLNIHAGASGVEIEVGTDGPGIVNTLKIAGANGLSEVNDPIYNPQRNNTVVATYSGTIPANVGPGLWTFTPTVSGAYMLQVNINVANADVIPANGIIEWVLNVGGGEVQYCSNTLKSISIAKASDFVGLDQPMDYSFSNLATLTAGQAVSFALYTAIATGSLAWNIGVAGVSGYQVRLIKMC